MSQSRLVVLATLATIVAGFAATSRAATAQQAPMARLAFLHMSADAPALDIYVDGSREVDALAFRETSPYISLTPGAHAIQVSPAKRQDALLSTVPTFAAGTSSTWVLSGVLNAADITIPLTPDIQFGRTIQLNDTAADTSDGRPRIRAVNASPGSGPLDVRIEETPPVLVATALQYGNVSGYTPADAGTYAISLLNGGMIVATIPSFTVAAKTAYTLVLGGLFPSVIATNPTNTVQAFQPVILTDQTSQRSAPLTKGCNQVILPQPVGTPIATIVSRIDNPAAVNSVWRFDNATKLLRAGFFIDTSAPVDYTATLVSPEAEFICVNSTTSWNPSG